MPLQSVEPQRLYRQIADQLRALIGQAEFEVGQRLPAERDLARQLGVSRPSVREALIALEVEGWVEVRTGSGVYVLDRSRRTTAPVAPTEWGPLELIRARRVVEGETAAIAAQQRKRSDIAALNRSIESMRELAARQQNPLEGDCAFHVSIARAGGNAVLTETVQGFWDSRRGPIFTRLDDLFEAQTSWHAAIAEHEDIRDAIAAGDANSARRAMHEHLDKSHRRYSASWRRAKGIT